MAKRTNSVQMQQANEHADVPELEGFELRQVLWQRASDFGLLATTHGDLQAAIS
jgi:hypothetical protein